MYNEKGFTIVELIVVIAVLAILVLLATPKFIGYTETAKITQIKNDIKAYEGFTTLSKLEEENITSEWNVLLPRERDSLEGKVYDKRGEVSLPNEILYIIPETKDVKSNLEGTFLTNENNNVYYSTEKFIGGSLDDLEYGEPVIDSSLFVWVPAPEEAESYSAVGKSEKGYFKYIGTGIQSLFIPHEIEGNPMKSYYKMFTETGDELRKITSTNKNVYDMRYMFYNTNVKDVNLISLGTSEVINMSYMFSNSNIENIKFGGNFNTSKTTRMQGMFEYTPKLKVLDISTFDTSEVTRMNNMFKQSGVKKLDLRKFDTTKVEIMTGMFNGAEANLINVSTWNTSNVTNMSIMFNKTIAPLNLSNFNTSNVEHFSYMFSGSHSEKIIGIENFKTSSAKNLRGMFEAARVEALDLKEWNVLNVTNMQDLFQAAENLKLLDVSTWNTSNVTNMSGTFAGLEGLTSETSLKLPDFNTSNVTDMSNMFYHYPHAKIDSNINTLDTENVVDMSTMFEGTHLTNLSLHNFDTSKVENMEKMFYASRFFKTLNLDTFNTLNVVNMKDMFRDIGSRDLILDISNFVIGSQADLTDFITEGRIDTLYVSDSSIEERLKVESSFYDVDFQIK